MLTEWEMLRVRACFMLERVRACSLSLPFSISVWPTDVSVPCLTSEEGGRALCLQGCGRALSPPSLSFSLWPAKRVCVNVLYACKGMHTLFTGQMKRERKKEGGRKWEWTWERGRERCRICPEMLFLFLKGMAGASAPFSYLVIKE